MMGKKVWGAEIVRQIMIMMPLILILILSGAQGARDINNKRIDGNGGSGGNGGGTGGGGNPSTPTPTPTPPPPPPPPGAAGGGAPPGAGGAPPGTGGAPPGGGAAPASPAPATWVTCSLGAAAHLLPCLPSLGFNFSGQNVGGSWGWSPQGCCNGIANINPNCLNAILNFFQPFLNATLSAAVASCS